MEDVAKIAGGLFLRYTWTRQTAEPSRQINYQVDNELLSWEV